MPFKSQPSSAALRMTHSHTHQHFQVTSEGQVTPQSCEHQSDQLQQRPLKPPEPKHSYFSLQVFDVDARLDRCDIEGKGKSTRACALPLPEKLEK